MVNKLAAVGDPATLDLDLGPLRVAVRGGAAEVEPEPVVPVAAVVAEQVGGAAVGGEEDVEVAVAVDVGVGAPPADDRAEQVGADLGLVDEDEHLAARRPVFQKSWADWA